jgi:hypothetical protein
MNTLREYYSRFLRLHFAWRTGFGVVSGVALVLAWRFWFLDLPGPVQTGLLTVLAAMIAFAAAWIGVQEHARREQVARQEEMKKQVYFELAETIANVRVYILKQSWPSIDENELQGLIKDFPIISARFHIVGDMEGIECLLRITELLQKCISELIFDRAELKRMWDDCEQSKRVKIDAFERVKGSAVRPGETPEQFTARVMPPYWEIEKLDAGARQKMAFHSVIMTEKINLLLSEFGELDVRSVILARKAFGFEINEQQYRRTFDECGLRMKKITVETVSRLKERLSAKASNANEQNPPGPPSSAT